MNILARTAFASARAKFILISAKIVNTAISAVFYCGTLKRRISVGLSFHSFGSTEYNAVQKTDLLLLLLVKHSTPKRISTSSRQFLWTQVSHIPPPTMTLFKIKIDDPRYLKNSVHEVLSAAEQIFDHVALLLPEVKQWRTDILTSTGDPKLWSGLNQPNSDVYRINAKSSVPYGVVMANYYVIAAKIKPSSITVYFDESRKGAIMKLFKADHFEEVSDDLRMENYDFGASSDGCAQIIFDSSDFRSAMDTLMISLSDSVYQPWRISCVYVQESLKERLLEYLTDERLESSIGGYAPPGNIIERSTEIHPRVAKKFGCVRRSKKDGSVTLFFDVQPKDLNGFYKPGEIKPITITFFRTIAEAATMLNTNSKSSLPSSLSIWTEVTTTLYSFISQVNTDTNLIWCNTISMIYTDLFERSADGIKTSHTIDQERKVVASCFDQNGRRKCLYVVFGK